MLIVFFCLVRPISKNENPKCIKNTRAVHKIDHKTNKGWVKLNNILINDFPLSGREWDSLVMQSKFSKSEEYEYLGSERWFGFSKNKSGHICLQDHPGKAFFKNIYIKELN